MKKWFCFLTALVLLFALAVPAFADEMDPPDYESATADAAGTDVILFDAADATTQALDAAANAYPDWDGKGAKVKVVDNTGTFSSDQLETLQTKCANIASTLNFDMGVVIEPDLVGDIDSMAADTYKRYGFGLGEKHDGCVFLIALNDHKYSLYTYGYGDYAITNAGAEYFADEIVRQFRAENYYGGCEFVVDTVEKFVNQARTGAPYDTDTLPKPPKAPFGWVKHIVIALAIGFIISLIVVNAMKKSLKSVHLQSSAANYQRQGSLNVRGGQEFFLYTSVARTPKPKPSETRSGGGGGMSHTSSGGGTSHSGSW